MADNSTPKSKTIPLVLAIMVSAVAVGTLFRSSIFSSTPSRAGLSSLSTTDENGDKWVLDLAKGQSLSAIKASGKKPGPALVIGTDVKISGGIASIGLVIEGQAGEKYAGGAKKNRRWLPPPRFKIVDEAGKTLANGAFKYG